MLLQQNTIRILLIFIFQFLTLNLLILKPSQARPGDVSCEENWKDNNTNKTVLVTVIENTTGITKVFIYWVEEVAGKTPTQRCKEVSKKIQEAVDNSTWRETFLRTGCGDSAICLVIDDEDRECREDEIIVKLPKDKSAKLSIAKMLGFRGPLRFSPDYSFPSGEQYPAFYVDINRFLKTIESSETE